MNLFDFIKAHPATLTIENELMEKLLEVDKWHNNRRQTIKSSKL